MLEMYWYWCWAGTRGTESSVLGQEVVSYKEVGVQGNFWKGRDSMQVAVWWETGTTYQQEWT